MTLGGDISKFDSFFLAPMLLIRTGFESEESGTRNIGAMFPYRDVVLLIRTGFESATLGLSGASVSVCNLHIECVDRI